MLGDRSFMVNEDGNLYSIFLRKLFIFLLEKNTLHL